MLKMTNATKAGILGVVNAALGLAVAFNVALTGPQQGAIIAVVNTALTLWVGLTFTNSAKRVNTP